MKMNSLVRNPRILIGAVTLLAAVVWSSAPVDTVTANPSPEWRPVSPNIKLAICLDTSGSMEGLIESAKQKLWAVVNDLALAQPTPRLEVALLTYGNFAHSPENGWVHVDIPFTDDLDAVSERLFALRTDGDTEYVGRVLGKAGQLDWGYGDQFLRIAVVAGNESADQDRTVRYHSVCPDLRSRGIIVNSIYCGPASDEVAPGWREVARLSGGEFASIDHNEGIVLIPTPYDDRLEELSRMLNSTYIPVGAKGAAGLANQTAQDENAAKLSSSAKASRAKTKASALYNCAWDLIDGYKTGEIKVSKIETADLPEELRGLSATELTARIEELAAERTRIQAEIKKLGLDRDRFVEEEKRRQALDDSRSFDHAIRRAVRRQAEARGFEFPKQGVSPDRAGDLDLFGRGGPAEEGC